MRCKHGVGVSAGMALSLCMGQAHGMEANALNGSEQPFAALHIGLTLTPTLGLDAGLEVTFPRFRLLPRFVTRVDAEALADFKAPSFLGQPGTLAELMLCQTRYADGTVGKRFYAGGGLGLFYNGEAQFGGKLYVGKELTHVVGLEAGLHLPTNQDPEITLHFRIEL